MMPDIGHGDRNEFSKSAAPIDANSHCVFAKMAATRQAIAPSAADYMPLRTDDYSRKEVLHIRTHLDDFADEFVSHNHRHRNRLLRPRVPLVNMQVSAANAGSVDTNEHIVDADGRLGHV